MTSMQRNPRLVASTGSLKQPAAKPSQVQTPARQTGPSVEAKSNERVAAPSTPGNSGTASSSLFTPLLSRADRSSMPASAISKSPAEPLSGPSGPVLDSPRRDAADSDSDSGLDGSSDSIFSLDDEDKEEELTHPEEDSDDAEDNEDSEVPQDSDNHDDPNPVEESKHRPTCPWNDRPCESEIVEELKGCKELHEREDISKRLLSFVARDGEVALKCLAAFVSDTFVSVRPVYKRHARQRDASIDDAIKKLNVSIASVRAHLKRSVGESKAKDYLPSSDHEPRLLLALTTVLVARLQMLKTTTPRRQVTFVDGASEEHEAASLRQAQGPRSQQQTGNRRPPEHKSARPRSPPPSRPSDSTSASDASRSRDDTARRLYQQFANFMSQQERLNKALLERTDKLARHQNQPRESYDDMDGLIQSLNLDRLNFQELQLLFANLKARIDSYRARHPREELIVDVDALEDSESEDAAQNQHNSEPDTFCIAYFEAAVDADRLRNAILRRVRSGSWKRTINEYLQTHPLNESSTIVNLSLPFFRGRRTAINIINAILTSLSGRIKPLKVLADSVINPGSESNSESPLANNQDARRQNSKGHSANGPARVQRGRKDRDNNNHSSSNNNNISNNDNNNNPNRRGGSNNSNNGRSSNNNNDNNRNKRDSPNNRSNNRNDHENNNNNSRRSNNNTNNNNSGRSGSGSNNSDSRRDRSGFPSQAVGFPQSVPNLSVVYNWNSTAPPRGGKRPNGRQH